MDTAIIIHPTANPKPSRDRSVETHGRDLDYSVTVNRSPGHFLPTLTFEEFMALPNAPHRADCPLHPTRRPKELDEYAIDQKAIVRVLNILDSFVPSTPRVESAIHEIRWRLLSVHPHCLNYA